MTYQTIVLLTVLLCLASPAMALGPTRAEGALAREWATGRFDGTKAVPFSFVYDGKPSAELLKQWKLEKSSKKLDSRRRQQTLTYTDPKSGLQVRCVSVQYSDYPVVEWTVYLKNTSSADTPIISEIQGIDASVQAPSACDFILDHNVGTLVTAEDYRPLQDKIEVGGKLHFAPFAGRPCGREFPYYNLGYTTRGAQDDRSGVIIAIGWPGQWATDFVCESDTTVKIRAGQELTHLKLHPGEEVRSPLIAMLFYKGDRERSQNIWRRWMLAHNVPKPGGKPIPPRLPAVSGNQMPGLKCNELDEKRYLDGFRNAGIKLDMWWMDAGWYPCGDSWPNTGTWEVDKERFPNGIKAVADYVHAQGMKLIVWFEPERAVDGSELVKEHPTYMLMNTSAGRQANGLVDLGNPEALKWVVERVDKIIVEQGIDYYRQDFNFFPLDNWRANDAPDRQGITENKHCVGYLALWDELLRRHPDMVIDSCSSGGHRNDLETLRRSVPLLRSDYIFDPVGEQCHTYGFASWVPYWGTGFIDFNDYIVRSTQGPNTTLGQDARRSDLDWPLLKRLIEQWRSVADNYLGDFYTLTPYSLGQDAWMAWQFDRPEAGKGIVQAFRRSECAGDSITVKPRGLEPSAEYVVTDIDTDSPKRHKGRELMDGGLTVAIGGKPGAVVITYEKIGTR